MAWLKIGRVGGEGITVLLEEKNNIDRVRVELWIRNCSYRPMGQRYRGLCRQGWPIFDLR